MVLITRSDAIVDPLGRMILADFDTGASQGAVYLLVPEPGALGFLVLGGSALLLRGGARTPGRCVSRKTCYAFIKIAFCDKSGLLCYDFPLGLNASFNRRRLAAVVFSSLELRKKCLFLHFGLHADILRGIKDLAFTRPTPIQEQSIGPAMEGRDLLACAATGSGKTAAVYAADDSSSHEQTGYARGAQAAGVDADARTCGADSR